MRFWLLAFCLAFSFVALGQDIRPDSITIKDTAVAKEKNIKLPPVNLYVEGMIIYAESPADYGFSRQIGAGVGYKRLNAGVFQALFANDYHTFLVFPNQFTLLYTHGGGYLGYQFLNTKFLEIGLRFNYSRGDMVWENNETKEDFLRDEFQVIKPEVILFLVPLRFVRLTTNVGYNHYDDLELPSVSSKDFSGLTLGVGLQIGYFHK